ncbi:MAG: ImmA/IrrE family metallo-endopeptidase [Paeniclostridium sp.]|nr:ImmA/IrrE family metallo-endopeptidase [Paeniclostridium sp.]MBW4862148.1 ImmA/IrrE family metallo-endopeptidase [Paeniclostridium sp.]MBW4875506.1 ImmA/IrrE family metallo-endopeptidase [Paeniclostridium sp.]
MEERLNIIDDMADGIRDIILGENKEKIVDIEDVVSKLDGEIYEVDDINKSCILKKGDSFVIKLSKNLNEKQKRLWAAFELGNLFINMGYKIDPENFKKYNDGVEFNSEDEYEDELALLFGIAFLIPKKLFISKMKENYDGEGIYNIKNVADYFNVQEKVVVFRGRNLGLLAKGDK